MQMKPYMGMFLLPFHIEKGCKMQVTEFVWLYNPPLPHYHHHHHNKPTHAYPCRSRNGGLGKFPPWFHPQAKLFKRLWKAKII